MHSLADIRLRHVGSLSNNGDPQKHAVPPMIQGDVSRTFLDHPLFARTKADKPLGLGRMLSVRNELDDVKNVILFHRYGDHEELGRSPSGITSNLVCHNDINIFSLLEETSCLPYVSYDCVKAAIYDQ
ncbi:hypothetical protein [Kerstersia gyiorum]|uniref:hypothetical protein n=1 Tax=Kerstersia gyiorum TaxID=206506 RepID=UPI00209CDA58|nr:hypothetical protein [Kerstersia gyiorum]MCP1633228.1 hypothetical protein [Kerstersia gyiorum]MCP1636099.1 hypothetical protein [Kerstersia gyiorum]MCP1680302.1 hypothetical protein [Kerstersia gyiorum]MCP1681811.1 hypothetical protein [Kerstersia gyiorum]MCP1713758.1 hypothetical protein [Kerstersia gyiorum]